MAKRHGWDDTIADLRTLSHDFAAPVTALMERLAPEWSDRVVAKRILLSYPPGLGVGFRAVADGLKEKAPEVYLCWDDDVYDVRLLTDNPPDGHCRQVHR